MRVSPDRASRPAPSRPRPRHKGCWKSWAHLDSTERCGSTSSLFIKRSRTGSGIAEPSDSDWTASVLARSDPLGSRIRAVSGKEAPAVADPGLNNPACGKAVDRAWQLLHDLLRDACGVWRGSVSGPRSTTGHVLGLDPRRMPGMRWTSRDRATPRATGTALLQRAAVPTSSVSLSRLRHQPGLGSPTARRCVGRRRSGRPQRTLLRSAAVVADAVLRPASVGLQRTPPRRPPVLCWRRST